MMLLRGYLLLITKFIVSRLDMNRESKPEYVEPPALVLINESEFEYILPFYYQAWFWLIVGILIGFLIGQHIT